MEQLKGIFGKKKGNSTKKEVKSSLDDHTEKMGKLKISAASDEAVGIEIVPDPETDRPSRVWSKMKVEQLYKEVEPLNIHTPIFPHCIRFVCISDTHSKLKPDDPIPTFHIPPGDILLHAGDFTMKGGMSEIERFNAFLGTLNHKKKIVIAGNHDLPFDEIHFMDHIVFGQNFGAMRRHLDTKGLKSVKDLLTNAVYLQDSMVTVCGINIYGSPWLPRFCNWAFNLDRGAQILEKWNWIPENVDILMTHGPPVGHGDTTKGGINVGCLELLNTVQRRVKPQYHVFGHIHESYGMTTDGVTTFINAASCTKGYKLSNPPIIFDVPIPDGQSKESLLDTVDVVSFSKDALVNSDTVRKPKRDRACHMSHDQLLSGIKIKSE